MAETVTGIQDYETDIVFDLRELNILVREVGDKLLPKNDVNVYA